MKTIKKIFLIVSAFIIILVAGFLCFIACDQNILPTTKTDNKFEIYINSTHILSPNDPTKIEITNDQPCLLKALSGYSFKLIFDQETYSSLPTNKEFNNSQEYFELTLIPGKKQIVTIDNSYDAKVILTSDGLFTITFYPNGTQKILPIAVSLIITGLVIYALKKIFKEFKKLKKPTT
jgi:hypothetical protein